MPNQDKQPDNKHSWQTGPSANDQVRMLNSVKFRVATPKANPAIVDAKPGEFVLTLPAGEKLKAGSEFQTVMTRSFARMVQRRELEIWLPKPKQQN